MRKPIDVEKASDILREVQHAIYHFKQSNLDEEGQHGFPNLLRAEKKLREAMLYDVVFASVAAEVNGPTVTVGCTAHCRCGHSFAADFESALSAVAAKGEGDDSTNEA